MSHSAKAPPEATELFYASIVATAMVYISGVAIMTVLVMATSDPGEWPHLVGTMVFQALAGAILATFAGFVLIAPLGTAFGLAMLRVSPPGWWQGPITGVLVALALEGLVLSIVNQQAIRPSLANAFVMGLPILLACLAGGFVQRRVLKWPNRASLSA